MVILVFLNLKPRFTKKETFHVQVIQRCATGAHESDGRGIVALLEHGGICSAKSQNSIWRRYINRDFVDRGSFGAGEGQSRGLLDHFLLKRRIGNPSSDELSS